MQLVVDVYSQPSCMQCKLTKKALDRHGVPYAEHDVSVDDDAADRVRALGYAGVPVVAVTLPDGVDHWHGFRPDQLDALACLAKGA